MRKRRSGPVGDGSVDGNFYDAKSPQHGIGDV